MILLTPESIKNNESKTCMNTYNESIRHYNSSKLSKVNKKTSNNEEHLNSLNTNIDNNEATSNCNLNNNLTSTNIKAVNNNSTSLIEICEVPLNNISVMNENEIDIKNNSSSTSLNNYDNHNRPIFINECVQEIDSNINPKLKILDSENTKMYLTSANTNLCNELIDVNNLGKKEIILSSDEHSNEISFDCVKANKINKLNQSKIKDNNSKLKVNNNLLEDNCSIQSNSFINDSNLSDKINASKNLNKPIKLNTVTTEPYPKYTPTVEKAIKKYENKQPKKECIIM